MSWNRVIYKVKEEVNSYKILPGWLSVLLILISFQALVLLVFVNNLGKYIPESAIGLSEEDYVDRIVIHNWKSWMDELNISNEQKS